MAPRLTARAVAELRQLLRLLRRASKRLRAFLNAIEAEDANEPAQVRAPHRPRAAGDNAGLWMWRGGHWLIQFGAEELSARDSLGVRYLAHLLSRPWQPVEAWELFAAEHHLRAAEPPLGNAEVSVKQPEKTGAALLDRRALAEFRQRLQEVAFELDRAERNNDLGARQALAQEREWLLRELRRARLSRATPPELERARQAVSKSIQRAIDRLSKHCPTLGRHLRATIHCGFRCWYRPPPESSIRWQVVHPQ